MDIDAAARRLAFKSGLPLRFDITSFEKYKLHKYALSHFNTVEEFCDSGGDQTTSGTQFPISSAIGAMDTHGTKGPSCSGTVLVFLLKTYWS
jgi:hypothetical protein